MPAGKARSQPTAGFTLRVQFGVILTTQVMHVVAVSVKSELPSPYAKSPPFPADFKYLAGGILSDLIVFYTTVP